MADTSRLPRFGTDGVRGEANTDLTPDVAVALARAASEVLGSGPNNQVVIGRDTRQSGPMLEAALVAGYTSYGVNIELLGEVPTPAVAWAAADAACPGVMISASHNPFADNGIKLFAGGGTKLDDETEAAIESLMLALLGGTTSARSVAANQVGGVSQSTGALGWATSVEQSIAGRTLDGVRVVLDCANGSASRLGPDVFRALGADVSVIGTEPNGVNINDRVGSTYPQELQRVVAESGSDVGLAFDGDADRLIAVDHSGALVDGDHLLAILAIDWKATGRLYQDTVVVTVMSNLGFKLAMGEAGVVVVETKVGDRYVLEELNRGVNGRSFSLGGEQSGHVICRDLASTGDGVLAGVQLLDTMRRTGSSLQDLAGNAMTTFPQVLKNVRLPHQDPHISDLLTDVVVAAKAELGDKGRVLVRPSGTEPLVRIMVEHLDAETAHRVCDELVAVATERVGQLPKG